MFNELDIVKARYNIYLVKNKNSYFTTCCKSKISNKDIIFVIKKGTKGTIVMNYNTADCEVEFFDENNNTIAICEFGYTLTLNKKYLTLYSKYLPTTTTKLKDKNDKSSTAMAK